MEDIFYWCRENNTIQVRLWLDDTENDFQKGLVEKFWQFPYLEVIFTRVWRYLIFYLFTMF